MVSIGRVLMWGTELGLRALEAAVERVSPPPGPPAIEHYDPIPPPPQEEIMPEQQPPQPVVQWGLKVPNGNIVWDNALYCGNPLATPEHRTSVLEALKKTAGELGFAPEDFLRDFGWVRRVGVPALAWGDAAIVPLIEQEQEPPVNGHAFGSTEVSGLAAATEGGHNAIG